MTGTVIADPYDIFHILVVRAHGTSYGSAIQYALNSSKNLLGMKYGGRWMDPSFSSTYKLFPCFYTYQMYLIPYRVDGQHNKEKYIMMMGARSSDLIVSLIGLMRPIHFGWFVGA
jgi:hypothetical protein